MSDTQRLQTAIQALAGQCGLVAAISSDVPYVLHPAVVSDFLKTSRAIGLAGLSQLIAREFATADNKTDKKVKVEKGKEKEKVDVLSSLKADKKGPIHISFYYSRKLSVDTKFEKEANPRIVKPQSDPSALAVNADLNSRLASIALPVAPPAVVVKVLQVKIARGTVAVKAGFTIRTGTVDLKYLLADSSTSVIMEEEALRSSLPDIDETTELVDLTPLFSDELPKFSAAQSPVESIQVANFIKMVKELNKNTEFVSNLTKLFHTPGSKCSRIKDLTTLLQSPLVPLVIRDEKKADTFAALPNGASKTMSDRYADRLKATLSASVATESVVAEPEWDSKLNEKWDVVDFPDERAARVAVDKKLNDSYGQSGSARLQTPVAVASIALLAHWIIELSAAGSSLIAIPKMSREKALKALGQSEVPSNTATYSAVMGQVRRCLLPAHRLHPAAVDLVVTTIDSAKAAEASSGAAKKRGSKSAGASKSADAVESTSELFGRCKLIQQVSGDGDIPVLSSRMDGGETTVKLETETSKSFSVKGPASIVSFVNAQFGKKPNQFACLIEASAESIVLIGFAPSKDSAFNPERLFRLGARDSLRIPSSLVTMPADAEFEKHCRALGTSGQQIVTAIRNMALSKRDLMIITVPCSVNLERALGVEDGLLDDATKSRLLDLIVREDGESIQNFRHAHMRR